jgi:hypothetical protein
VGDNLHKIIESSLVAQKPIQPVLPEYFFVCKLIGLRYALSSSTKFVELEKVAKFCCLFVL